MQLKYNANLAKFLFKSKHFILFILKNNNITIKIKKLILQFSFLNGIVE